jgi:hypothetical protein
MNFKMKALVAAVALTASMAANATMSTNATGDSSLILTLVDNTNNISLTVDLGYSHTTFDRNGNFTWDIASGDYASAWNTFWATASMATTQWAVVSADGSATATAAAPNSVFTTNSALVTNANLPSYTQLSTAVGVFDQYIQGNNAIGNHQAVANGASVATSGNAWAENSFAYGTAGTYGSVAGFGDTTGAIDGNLFVYNYVANGTSGLTKVARTQYATGAGFNPYFNLSSNGVLNYTAAVAAVPEADTSAMLLAGLGLMGFIARRRTAA